MKIALCQRAQKQCSLPPLLPSGGRPVIQDWRDIRTIKELNQFQEDYRRLPGSEKEIILRQMVETIALQRNREHDQREKPPQAEKPSLRVHRNGNGRRRRRG